MRLYTTLLSFNRGISGSIHPLGKPSCGTVKSITHSVSTTLVNKPPVSSSALSYSSSSSSSCFHSYRNYTPHRYYSMTSQPRLLTGKPWSLDSISVLVLNGMISWYWCCGCHLLLETLQVLQCQRSLPLQL